MVTTRVLNPHRRVTKRRNGPHLLIVNHGGGMAKAKKKATPKRRTNTRRTYNPRRKHHKPRTHNTRRKPNKRRTYNPRRVNAGHHHHKGVRHYRKRRHNPSLSGLTGLLEKTIVALIGTGVTSWAYSFIGPMVPIGGILGQVGIKLGLAWGLGEAAKKMGFAKYAEMLTIGGALSAGNDVINFALPNVFPTALPAAPALKPGQALLPADATGDSSTPSMSEIVYAPAGYGHLGDIVYGPGGSYLYQ